MHLSPFPHIRRPALYLQAVSAGKMGTKEAYCASSQARGRLQEEPQGQGRQKGGANARAGEAGCANARAGGEA